MKWGYNPPPGPRGPLLAPLCRAGDLRSVQPFLRELDALCRRRGFLLEAEANEYSAGLSVVDLDQKDLPGHYRPVPRLPGLSRANFTAICWRPGRIER